jgi:hypothetical protein
MPKRNSTRESVTLGQMPRRRVPGSDAVAITLRCYPDKVVLGPSSGIPLATDEDVASAHRAFADELDALPELYTGSADPGSIVGLDAFIPGGDTATDGDPEWTDPDPS